MYYVEVVVTCKYNTYLQLLFSNVLVWFSSLEQLFSNALYYVAYH